PPQGCRASSRCPPPPDRARTRDVRPHSRPSGGCPALRAGCSSAGRRWRRSLPLQPQLARQRGDAAHEGAADAEDVQTHGGSLQTGSPLPLADAGKGYGWPCFEERGRGVGERGFGAAATREDGASSTPRPSPLPAGEREIPVAQPFAAADSALSAAFTRAVISSSSPTPSTTCSLPRLA